MILGINGYIKLSKSGSPSGVKRDLMTSQFKINNQYKLVQMLRTGA